METEIRDFLSKINKNEIEETALFGIKDIDPDYNDEENYIFANKNGLLVFAYELLQAYLLADDVIKKKGKHFIPFPWDAKWIDRDSSTVISFIEPTDIPNSTEISEEHSKIETILNGIIGFGVLFLFLSMIPLSIIGLDTLIRWLW